MDSSPLALASFGVPLGLLIGLWAGVSGYSGWPLVVPLLFVVAEVPLYQTLAASMGIDFVNAVTVGALAQRRGDADLRWAGRLALAALPVALAGALLAFAILGRATDLLKGAAGLVSIALGAILVARAARRGRAEAHAGACPAGPPAGLPGSTRRRALVRAGALAIALLMGLIGMGGGFALAFLLIVILDLPARRGVGTAMVFTACVLPAVLVAYLCFAGLPPPLWRALAPCAVASCLGCVLGARFAGRVIERRLTFAIGACVIVAGVVASVQARLLASP